MGFFFWPALVIMLQHMLVDMRLGGEVVFLVEQRGRFVFQIIPLLDTTVTDGGNMLTSSSSMLAVQVGCVLHVLSTSADYSAEH